MAQPAESGDPPKGVWAAAQLAIAVAAVLWGATLFMYPSPEGAPSREFQRDALVPGASIAAGLFFFVAFLLYLRHHPDARIVGLFGVAIFAAANIWWAIDRYQLFVGEHCDTPLTATGPCSYPFRAGADHPDALPDWMGGRVGAILGAVVIIVILQSVLLLMVTLWHRGQRRLAQERSRAAAEDAWNQAPGRRA